MKMRNLKEMQWFLNVIDSIIIHIRSSETLRVTNHELRIFAWKQNKAKRIKQIKWNKIKYTL